MSYGVGGVAKGGDDCRYWMHEIGVYRRKCKSCQKHKNLRGRGFLGTARPLATPFDVRDRMLLNLVGKL